MVQFYITDLHSIFIVSLDKEQKSDNKCEK